MADLDYQTQRLLEKLQKQLQETLDRQNIAYMGGTKVVRIPRISPERLRKLPRESNQEDYSVEYIADQWYDEETGQSRNRKYIIGMVLHEYPMAMIPNDNYYKYFDEATGRPKVLPGTKNPARLIEAKRPETNANRAEAGTAKPAGLTETRPQNPANIKETAETRSTRAKETTEAKEAAEASETEEDTSDIDDAIDEFLKGIEKHRKEAEAALIRNAEEEERRKRNLELYGELDYSDVERQEAIQSLMALFDEAEKEETGTEDTMKKDEQPENKTEATQTTKTTTAETTTPKTTTAKTTTPKATTPKAERPNTEEAETPPTENASHGNADNPELQQTYREYKNAKERQAILGKILNEILSSIRNLAKKRPDDIVNEYKANRINRLLKEAISRYENTDYTDLMELIELPREEEKDGEIVRTGMTYSDLELLLDHYCTILHFIPSGK